MTRGKLSAFIALGAFGCLTDQPDVASQSEGVAAHSAVAPPGQADSLSSVIAGLEPKLAPISAMLDSMVGVLRPDSGTIRADSAFQRFRERFDDLVRATASTFFADSALQVAVYPDGAAAQSIAARRRKLGMPVDTLDIADSAIADSLVAFLNNRAIWTAFEEGQAYFVASESSLLRRLGRFLTPATQEYLRLATLEQTRPTASDASVMISWDELSERLAWTDRLLKTYPDAAASDELKRWYLGYLGLYVRGTDNTKLFPGGSRVLDSEVRQSYERYIHKYRSTQSGEFIRAYLEILRRNAYRYTADAAEYLRRQGGLWAPDARP